ncbi:MAG: hypothetical protein FD167_2160, partial [bacterium]
NSIADPKNNTFIILTMVALCYLCWGISTPFFVRRPIRWVWRFSIGSTGSQLSDVAKDKHLLFFERIVLILCFLTVVFSDWFLYTMSVNNYLPDVFFWVAQLITALGVIYIIWLVWQEVSLAARMWKKGRKDFKKIISELKKDG